MDGEAIKLYRDIFRLNLKVGFKHDIQATVTDLELWKTILTEWKAKKWSPFSVKWMLSEYERREKQSKRSDGSLRSESEGNSNASTARIPEWRNRDLSPLQETEGVHARAGSQTLDEIVTRALRAADRSTN